MTMKPNYRHERTQKARTRELKRQEKQRQREEISAKRKSAHTDGASGGLEGVDITQVDDPGKPGAP
jgi:hypothetical protein